MKSNYEVISNGIDILYRKSIVKCNRDKEHKKCKDRKGDVDEKNFQQLIKCWKDNTNYDSYFEELIDYINIESFSDVIIDNMIDNNIGIEKISHISFENNILLKLAHVSEDASLLLFKRLYTNNKYSVNELIELLRKLMNVKGIKYCKEIRKKAKETLENKVKMHK